MALPRSFFVKLGIASFFMGAGMELFMIHTGFYDVVTRTEAERYIENKADRQRLQAEIQKHLCEKGIDLDLPASKA